MSNAIDPRDFTTIIDNPFFTLRPGTTFVVEDRDGNSASTIVVTHETKIVDGVTCVVVHDTGTVNGIVTEDTFDWFAQDKDGNVWYFGEATAEFTPGNPVPDNTEGSWEAGVDGAKPGIVMEAYPRRGDVYQQEHAPGVAEDTAKVLGLSPQVDTIYGSFANALKTLEFSPLSDVTEVKYYAAGVGFVAAQTSDGEHEQLSRVIVDGGAGNDEVIGYAGGDVMRGDAGRDLVRGLGGNDSMSGGAGNDTLSGGNGGDVLSGGSGEDWLIGGDGADRFVFTGLTNGVVETDTISGYRKGDVDVIALAHGLRSIAGQEQADGAWSLTLKGDGDVIVLTGAVDFNHDGRIIDDLLIV